MHPYERVKKAREKGRPTAASYIRQIFRDFYEIHGDRLFADDPAILSGIATLEDRPVTVIGCEKGVDTEEKVRRNFGSANPEGYRKALRAMKQAEKFSRPVVCFVDTSGASCAIGAEERGQGSALAQNLMEMMSLRTPVITVMIGEGGSGGALALSVANEVWMLENAYYSVISPEGAASIMWKDAARVKEACASLKLTAQDLHRLGVADKVFSEQDFSAVFPALKYALLDAFDYYASLSISQLLAQRYEKFRKIGRTEL